VHAAKKIIAILNGLDPLEAGAAFGRAWSIYRRHLDAVDAKKKSRPRTRASK
jgi:hypothetical protein